MFIIMDKFKLLFVASFLLSVVSFASRPTIFKDEEFIAGPIWKLMEHKAQYWPAKSVWLLRESKSIPGAVTVTYYDMASGSPNGFANRIYVLKKSSGWTLSDPNQAKDLNGPKKDSFIPISADVEKEHTEELQNLYDVLKAFGLNISGQVFPTRMR